MITIKQGFTRYRLLVEEIFNDGKIEQFKVSGRNRSVVIESNRPYIRSIGLKKKRPQWKALDASLLNTSVIDKIVAAVMQHLEG